MLHLSFASASNDPLALMALGHQHYFHHYNKQDQSTYPSKAHGSMDEGGSFVPKSCASAVHYYRRAADVVGDHIVQHGVHIPKGKKDGCLQVL